MNNAVITLLAIALGLGAWASTGGSDQPAASSIRAGPHQRGPSTTQAERAAKPIRITRVTDPSGADSGIRADLNREWVAIKSFGHRTRQLRGWTLWDASGHVFRFPRFRLSPNTTVTVHTGDGRRTRHDLYWGMENYVWNNTGDRAVLSNRHDQLIDRCRVDGHRSC